jgi:hypothetical protein
VRRLNIIIGLWPNLATLIGALPLCAFALNSDCMVLAELFSTKGKAGNTVVLWKN